MTSGAMSGERGSAAIDVAGCTGVDGINGGLGGPQAMSVTKDAEVSTRAIVMPGGAACAVPPLRAGGRSPC